MVKKCVFQYFFKATLNCVFLFARLLTLVDRLLSTLIPEQLPMHFSKTSKAHNWPMMMVPIPCANIGYS
jgi:hypothetical protein